MYATDQIKIVARQLHEEADERTHRGDDRYDRQQLWETVRHASRAIEAVAELEDDDLPADARARRAHFLVAELESALEAARRARILVEWTSRRELDDF